MLHTFKMYYEPMNYSRPRAYLGVVLAPNWCVALHGAAEWFEVPFDGLIYQQLD